jgi:hypothetical protein
MDTDIAFLSDAEMEYVEEEQNFVEGASTSSTTSKPADEINIPGTSTSLHQDCEDVLEFMDSEEVDVETDEYQIDSEDDYKPEDSEGESEVDDEIPLNEEAARRSNEDSERTKLLFNRDPVFYLGVAKENLFFFDLAEEELGISRRDLYIVLFKIRRNEALKSIGDRFGLSTSTVSRIISNNIQKIAAHLSKFIFKPKKEDVLRNLPSNFKLRYSNVVRIIDCMEIPIGM